MLTAPRTPSRVIGIQYGMLSPDEIINTSVVEVKSKERFINNKPVIDGLFDPRMGVLEPKTICVTDGLTSLDSPGYFGHIILAKPMFFVQVRRQNWSFLYFYSHFLFLLCSTWKRLSSFWNAFASSAPSFWSTNRSMRTFGTWLRTSGGRWSKLSPRRLNGAAVRRRMAVAVSGRAKSK